ncbi:MAG: DUF58 domain-containing protein [Gammaproteobacteria bacterium]|nr:MAG: DUF58 domain-containing protein [Gammaproteobacteria bacterium]
MLLSLDSIKQYLPARLFAGAKGATEKPLLSENAILDLQHRVQSIHQPAVHSRDVAHAMYGDARSIYRGYGMDYEESRLYQPGDDLRFMNWRMSARTGRKYMKVFREERKPGVFILIDRRSAMRFGSQTRLKATQAVRAAAIVAFNAQKHGAAIEGVIIDQGLEWLVNMTGATGAYTLLEQARRPCPPVHHRHEEVAMGNILRLLLEILTPGSRLYLISDFIDLSNNDSASLMELAERHHLNVVHVFDPLEKNLPNIGNIRLHSADSRIGVAFDSGSKMSRGEYQKISHQHFSFRRGLFVSLGIPYVQLSTEEEQLESVIPLF